MEIEEEEEINEEVEINEDIFPENDLFALFQYLILILLGPDGGIIFIFIIWWDWWWWGQNPHKRVGDTVKKDERKEWLESFVYFTCLRGLQKPPDYTKLDEVENFDELGKWVVENLKSGFQKQVESRWERFNVLN